MRIKNIYQEGDYLLNPYQILRIKFKEFLWQTVRRINNEILGVKGLITSMNREFERLALN